MTATVDSASKTRHRSASKVELTWPSKQASSATSASRPKAPTNTFSVEFEQLIGAGADSMLIHGDAADALRQLARENADQKPPSAKFQLCYIDPPFNTGESFAHYRDKKDRHIWLEELREHLILAKALLADTGSLWLHIDDREQHRARCILDEVFGEEAFVATIIWQKRLTRDSRRAFSSMHDYIHVYAPAGPKAWKHVRNGLPDQGAFSNPDDDPKGPWRSVPMNVQAGHATAAQFYTVTTPTGARHDPPPGRCWTYTQKRLRELDLQGRVYWPRGGDGKPRLKRYQHESRGLSPFTIWTAEEVGDSGGAKKALMAECASAITFDTPKPLRLLERIIEISTNPGERVLDFYLGSGTTAIAASKLGRHWVGVEQSERTLTDFAIPRLLATPQNGTSVTLAKIINHPMHTS